MKQHEQVLLGIVRRALNIDDGSEVAQLLQSQIDWQAVFQLSAQQNVIAIAWQGLQQLFAEGVIPADKMPDRGLKLKWALSSEQVPQKYQHQERVIEKLAGVFRQHHIPLMILKGYGLSLNYPMPHLRKCSDIDIWTLGEQTKSDEILRKELGLKIDATKHHHTVFFLDGQMIENHFDFINIQSHLSNREVERKLQEYARVNYTKHSVGAEEILLPSPQFNATFILRHSAMHFAAECINLRHLLDWKYFVEHDHKGVDWQELETLCREQNMERFLHVVNTICVDYLGLNAALIPTFVREDALEERVMNEILHPEFSEKMPQGLNFLGRITYKTRRWWSNRWKHRIVYREGLFVTFIVQVFSHLYKPKSI